MQTESLTWLQVLAPTLFIVGSVYLVGSVLPIARGWARLSIFIVIWLTLAWYLQWRLTATVLPAKGAWYEIGWIWLCFSIELLAIFDQLILYVAFLRTTDRSGEADRHEARLRALPPAALPSVDVYIPTYSEPLEVLEKTITGALCLDYPNVSVWVLDDGRRPWLKAYCESKNVGYLNRPDNAHAKAGNINHALQLTNAEFVAIFDADFIPQRNFLMRTVGFFVDPAIGIVQTPHAFYNYDPMQSNLALRKSLPDEQRFFFDSIMPSRDGWDAAFCCGSNSVTRRIALESIGGGLPTQSITEDMLLTMSLLRKGYVTRYLSERLAFGLAPETVDAFFVQRQRWARGALQILYLAAGPFGRGLTLMQKLLFLPTHWLSLGLRSMIALLAPIVFLWSGISPVYAVRPADILYYFVPMVLALTGGMWVFAPQHHLPLASQVQGTFLSFKLLPIVLESLIKPFGHPFVTTPKGGSDHTSSYAGGIFWTAAALLGLTVLGVIINASPDLRIIPDAEVLPVVALWSVVNVVILFLVCLMALQAPKRRGEERLEIDEPIWIVSVAGTISSGRIKDISLSGVGLEGDGANALKAAIGDRVRVFVTEVGFIAGTVARRADLFIGVQFDLPASLERDLLIRKLFTAGLDNTEVTASTWSATLGILSSVWKLRSDMLKPQMAAMTAAAAPGEKLPAQSLVIKPEPAAVPLAQIVETRRRMAA